jgi:hypothetical protein
MNHNYFMDSTQTLTPGHKLNLIKSDGINIPFPTQLFLLWVKDAKPSVLAQ